MNSRRSAGLQRTLHASFFRAHAYEYDFFAFFGLGRPKTLKGDVNHVALGAAPWRAAEGHGRSSAKFGRSREAYRGY